MVMSFWKAVYFSFLFLVLYFLFTLGYTFSIMLGASYSKAIVP